MLTEHILFYQGHCPPLQQKLYLYNRKHAVRNRSSAHHLAARLMPATCTFVLRGLATPWKIHGLKWLVPYLLFHELCAGLSSVPDGINLIYDLLADDREQTYVDSGD